jgi:hypothetical protein
MEGTIPATSPPPFGVAEGVRCVPAGDIARIEGRPERFVIVGGGKTALDACVWLLEHGVGAEHIRWIRPREAWWMNRKFQQPHTLLPDFYRGVAAQIEAMAEAESVAAILARLESDEVLLRLDPGIVPTMFRGALVSEAELRLLRQIEDVIRLGRVQRIERDEIVLDQGRVPTDERTVHVHCAARGLARPTPRPIFESGRITIQPIMWGFACFQFATIGVVEATAESDDEKNWLCPPVRYWDVDDDYLRAFLATMIGDRVRAGNPALAAWSKASRLNPGGGVAAYREDPRVIDARERFKRFGVAAVANLQKLLAERDPS